jgi:hypothetical protein
MSASGSSIMFHTYITHDRKKDSSYMKFKKKIDVTRNKRAHHRRAALVLLIVLDGCRCSIVVSCSSYKMKAL